MRTQLLITYRVLSFDREVGGLVIEEHRVLVSAKRYCCAGGMSLGKVLQVCIKTILTKALTCFGLTHFFSLLVKALP